MKRIFLSLLVALGCLNMIPPAAVVMLFDRNFLREHIKDFCG